MKKSVKSQQILLIAVLCVSSIFLLCSCGQNGAMHDTAGDIVVPENSKQTLSAKGDTSVQEDIIDSESGKNFSEMSPGKQEAAYVYHTFFLPAMDGASQPYVGDTMPYYEDGVYYIYYLKDGGDSYNHSIYLATTTDFDQPLKSDCLYMDNQTNICCFVREMIRRGKKRIGFIGEIMHCQSFYERFLGYRNAMYLSGFSCPEEYCIIKNKEGTKTPGYAPYREYLKEQLQKLSELPDVFICANDFIAIDTMLVFKELGISVPQDVYLCGFDDSPESKVTTPTLTTVHIHSQIMGFSAVNLLMSRIKEPSLNFRKVYTETSLIYRESTAD